VPTPSELAGRNLSYAYGRQPVLHEATISVRGGQSVALVGPNGSGKTTALRLLSGDLRPLSGSVEVDGAPLRSLAAAERARRVGVVPQTIDPHLGFLSADLVRMGRAPYVGLLGTLSDDDRRAVRDALDATESGPLAARPFRELSGGEQQRVALAMALAQETPYLLLDEPTTHLDLHHQHALLELLRRLQRERALGLLAVMHDLNLAALYFDRLIVLNQGRVVGDGDPADLLTQPDILAVFTAPLSVVRHPDTAVPQVLLRPGEMGR
jgi:iron complex transport system ATP-binding protein